ncbi:MAG: hypothetical protein AB1324_00260 [Candidatus Micrarchaeota archaeon]
MAGGSLHATTIAATERRHAASGLPHPAFGRRSLVEASVSMMGFTFTTRIREGASVEELIEQVAKEHGGSVSKKYYAEFDAWEIHEVRIGSLVLRKNESEGIHFSLGLEGIPIALTENQGIVFPNAEELKVGSATRNIALWMTGEASNPLSMKDLDRAYSQKGGISISEDALERIQAAHGGSRSGKIVLEDNVLVLNKETGEVLSVSEHASKEEPKLPDDSFTHTATPPVQSPAEPGQMPVPANDASLAAIPYEIVRMFDGKFTDHVKVQFNPLPSECRPESAREMNTIAGLERVQERRLPPPTALRFSVLTFQLKESRSPPSVSHVSPFRESHPAETPKAANQAIPQQKNGGGAPKIDSRSVMRSWLLPRRDKVELGVPAAAKTVSIGAETKNLEMPRLECPETPEKPLRKKRRKKAEANPPRQSQTGIRVPVQLRSKSKKGPKPPKTPPKRAPSGPKRGPPASKRNRPPRAPVPLLPRAKSRARPLAAKPASRNRERGRKAGSISVSVHAPAPKQAKRKIDSHKLAANRAKKPSAPVSAKLPSRRKIPRHILLEMLGLFQNKWGRKFRMKKKRAV